MNRNSKKVNPSQSKFIYTLRLFNEKTEKLNGLGFVRAMMAAPAGVTLTFNQNADGSVHGKSERRGPSDEAIDSYILTFRFFIQDNEETSLRNLSRAYGDNKVDPAIQHELAKCQSVINQLLDAQTCIRINKKVLTNRDIMNTCVYGGRAHANVEKKKDYDAWMSTPVGALIDFEFTSTLWNILKGINFIKSLNDRILQGRSRAKASDTDL